MDNKLCLLWLPMEHTSLCSSYFHDLFISRGGADPGFLVGEGANPPGGGANIQICQIFPKKCMKLRKFWFVGGRPPPWIHHCRVYSPFVLSLQLMDYSDQYTIKILSFVSGTFCLFIRVSRNMIGIVGMLPLLSSASSDLLLTEVTMVGAYPGLTPGGSANSIFCQIRLKNYEMEKNLLPKPANESVDT